MRLHSRAPIHKPHLPLVLVSAFALGGLLASTTGCPAKATCPPCYVGDVMAPNTQNAAPKSAVYLQLDSSYSSEKVSEVKVTLTDSTGTTETLTYSGEKVKGINATSLTSIADGELYSVNGKPPVSAEVEFVFGSGKSTIPATISVKPEAKTATGPAATTTTTATTPTATTPAPAPVP